jgi:anti-sigma factor RsiW
VTCRELADFIDGYLSGDMAADMRRVFEDHLSLCGNCREYLAGYERSVALGHRAFEDDDAIVPRTVPDELVQAILSARARS